MKVATEKVNNFMVCRIAGEINLETSPELRKVCSQVIESGEKNVIVNFKEVGYIDSSGLATLIELFQKIKDKGGNLRLCSLVSKVKGVFELTKLDKVFKIVPTEEEALR